MCIKHNTQFLLQTIDRMTYGKRIHWIYFKYFVIFPFYSLLSHVFLFEIIFSSLNVLSLFKQINISKNMSLLHPKICSWFDHIWLNSSQKSCYNGSGWKIALMPMHFRFDGKNLFALLSIRPCKDFLGNTCNAIIGPHFHKRFFLQHVSEYNRFFLFLNRNGLNERTMHTLNDIIKYFSLFFYYHLFKWIRALETSSTTTKHIIPCKTDVLL